MYNYLFNITYTCRFNRINALVEHMKKDHNLMVHSSENSFSTFKDFLSWKQKEEECTRSYYVQHNAPSAVAQSHLKYYYFYCNRSGCYKGKGTGKRSIKVQGTAKTGSTCIAHIKVHEDVTTGVCIVNYTSTHCGHTPQLAHLPISSALKGKIASQLLAGVSIDRIMDEVRDVSMCESASVITRDHLVVRQDVSNIWRTLNLGNIKKHSNDQTSVAMWVNEVQQQEYNPVLVFKPQGENTEETDNLAEETFLLGIQTKFQRDVMIKFGNDGIICVDGTHGTNTYDFLLITIMIVDNYGEGIPVAWAISDREDSCTLVQFLKPLSERVGVIKPKVFMSDDADQYYTSWCGVFGAGPQKLLCMWHVDRAWRKAVQQNIIDKEMKVEVYHMLRVLLMERDESKFNLLLQQVLSYLEEKCPRFYEYMQRTYIKRVTQWATCYRVFTPINTNMFVESFHRLLKVVYLKHKQNRRVDYLLDVLMRINRDVSFNLLRKEEVGKRSHRLCEINKRHANAEKMMREGEMDVQKEGSNIWKVKSKSQYCYYEVVKNVVECSCPLRCMACKLCIHSFNCSCLDATLHNTICKHIHLLVLMSLDDENHETMQTCHDEARLDEGTSSSSPITSFRPNIGIDKISKATLLESISKLKQLVESCEDSSYFAEVNAHLASSITLIKTKKLPLLITRKRPAAPNSNSITQTRFFSTKKKRKTNTGLGKPTEEDTKTIKSKLEDIEPSVCGICFQEDDANISEGSVEWVACSRCSLWVHLACISCSSKTTIDYKNYRCKYCAYITE